MKLEWHISNRYLRAKKQGGTSLIAKVAILGLILAVMVLITVLSVMNGFHKELRNKVLSAISHGYVASYEKFTDYKDLQKNIEQQHGIVASSPYIEEYGLISYGGISTGINIRGIDINQESKTSQILNHIQGDNKFQKNNNIIIGIEISKQLGVEIGNKITIITTKMSSNIFNTSPRFKQFVISGIFESGSEYDASLVFIKLKQAQRLFNLKDQITGLHLKVDDVLIADKIIKNLAKKIDADRYYTTSWKEQKRNFITALNLEKQMMALILSLIVAVAVFNIISMMIMVIKDKKSDIAILRTFGFSAKQVRLTFFFLGIKIGILGIVIGSILGIILAGNIDSILKTVEIIFNIKIFPEDVFYINNFPSDIKLSDIILVISVSFILVVLSSIYPAKSASKINISQTLNSL